MKQLLIIALLPLFSTMLLAQPVGEAPRSMVLGSQNAFYVDFGEASTSFVEKGWKDFISSYGKVKKVKKSDEMIVSDVQIMEIGGAKMLNLYTRTEKTGTGTRQYLWIESGGKFVNSADDADAGKSIETLLKDFAHKIKVDEITIELEEQEKALESLDKDLQRLRKDKDSLHKTIEDAQERIAKAEEDILKNIQDQEIRLKEIEQQREVVDEVKARLENARTRKS
jgi:hypothetical protein